MGKGSAKIGAEIRAHLSGVLRDVMLNVTDALINTTPVDTGHASSNWILSTGSPYNGVDGSRAAVSYQAEQAGIAKVLAYDVGRDGPIYLRNNVEYLPKLDQGSSRQAPAGFVAAAFMGATAKAPRGRKQAARKMLRGMAKAAYRKGI